MVGRVSYPVRGRAGGTRIGPPMKWALTCPAEVIVTQRMRQEQTMASAPPTCRLTALPRATQGSGLSTEHVYILSGISVAFLLCLLLLVILLVHRLCQKKHGPLRSKGEKQSPQERFSPAVDIIQRTPDISAVSKLPEGERELHALSPAADPQEVTYAQLDHRVLTLRAAGAQSLQSTEPTADASTYAALAGR
uniref:Leukocyte-associated immunoglobulin-like receptor 1 n=1 Tax=Rousettus aegyptiacus TaxID=9407 RepID=A0A7J8CI58_ROUAE|nr:hypothetical protein HJG63_009055 [Rousettus aegyptiacus]